MSAPSARSVVLREVSEADLDVFFLFQLDAGARHMAAFTMQDPTDRDAFMAHWKRVMADERTVLRTILVDGEVAGDLSFFALCGQPAVSYWLGREYWGRGIATEALSLFLREVTIRPLYARAAADNVASRRVLEKCGFTLRGRDRYFANARGEEIDEVILILGQGNEEMGK